MQLTTSGILSSPSCMRTKFEAKPSQAIPTHPPLQFNFSAQKCTYIKHAQKQWLKLQWLSNFGVHHKAHKQL